MAGVLVATETGIEAFHDDGTRERELAGRSVGPLAAEAGGGCVALVNRREVWRRSPERTWAKLATAEIPLQSVFAGDNDIYLGGLDEPAVLRMTPDGEIGRLRGFDDVPGRGEWFAEGPPLGVRSLAALSDPDTLIAAVHVGGMPRSRDGGWTWTPTVPIRYDVHEVRAHPSLPGFVAAAATVGLCVSRDGGESWDVIAEGLDVTNSLALAVLEAEVLFSVQDGPFPRRSQIWRWPIGGSALQPVRQGLPEWLEGKVDTAQMASGRGRVALCDGGGNLWLSGARAQGWRRVAEGLGYVSGLLVL